MTNSDVSAVDAGIIRDWILVFFGGLLMLALAIIVYYMYGALPK